MRREEMPLLYLHADEGGWAEVKAVHTMVTGFVKNFCLFIAPWDATLAPVPLLRSKSAESNGLSIAQIHS